MLFNNRLVGKVDAALAGGGGHGQGYRVDKGRGRRGQPTEKRGVKGWKRPAN